MKKPQPWHVGVLIPARNEEKLLPRCLQSVLLAKANVGILASVDIVVVADSSVDRTLEIARDILRSNGIVRAISAGAVGPARSSAAHLSLARYVGPWSRCWLANTDADCIVPPDWLSRQLTLASSGIEAIAGIVAVDSFEEHGPEVPARFRSSYRTEPDGGHPHVHGANLGVRADAYLRAGGWGNLETAEDHDLWKRLAQTGALCHSTNRLEVRTSGRRVGRAPHGFAAALAAHNEDAA